LVKIPLNLAKIKIMGTQGMSLYVITVTVIRHRFEPWSSGHFLEATDRFLCHRLSTPRSMTGAAYTSQVVLCPLYIMRKKGTL